MATTTPHQPRWRSHYRLATAGLSLAACAVTLITSASSAGAAAGESTLTTNQTLSGGSSQSLVSPNREYQLVMQSDGNLVLYSPGRPLWATSTVGGSDRQLVLQGDGNLVVYDGGAHPLWCACGYGQPGDRLSLQDDGNLVLYAADNHPLWATNTTASVLPGGADLLGSNNQFLESPDRRYAAVMQSDGNFVVYGPGHVATFNTRTDNHAGAYLAMQSDGNLVIYDAGQHPLWSTATNPHAGARLVLQNDGNLVIYASNGQALWSIKTGPIGSYGGGANAYLCSSSSFSCDTTGYAGQMTWGYPGGHNCTNYAAWRLARVGVANPGNLGNAGDWARNAAAKGLRVDRTPAVGSVAQYNYGSAWAPRWGHVAYVIETGPGYVILAEDNWGTNILDIRRANAGTSAYPDNFIHF